MYSKEEEDGVRAAGGLPALYGGDGEVLESDEEEGEEVGMGESQRWRKKKKKKQAQSLLGRLEAKL